MSRSRYGFDENNRPYFMTCTVVGWLPVFTRPESVKIILDSWRFLQENTRLRLFGYVILENHLHLIASSSDISKEIGDFKSFTARRIIDLLKESKATTLLEQLRTQAIIRKKANQEFQLWQEGSHPQQIAGQEMMLQKLDYMHYNPVNRGYVDKPIDWRYSSARNYAGMEGLIEVITQWHK